MASGGHTRIGLEANVRLNKNSRALKHRLVRRVVDLCKNQQRTEAAWPQARSILNLSVPE
ncbi:MAG: hypothetical protein GKR97_12240 [Rhizobiaceae bacterium]|nr:hypothetical protein [Rhizobiaceae bacterium]